MNIKINALLLLFKSKQKLGIKAISYCLLQRMARMDMDQFNTMPAKITKKLLMV